MESLHGIVQQYRLDREHGFDTPESITAVGLR